MAVSLFSLDSQAKSQDVQIDPPHWWVGMKDTSLQLLVNRANIRDTEPSIDYKGVSIDSISRLDSPNYQLLYLTISDEAQPGLMEIVFTKGKKKTRVKYELRQREQAQFTPFDTEDLLYLVMPDRFANGNPKNDECRDILKNPVKVDRSNPDARHGGDLKGISDHLDYIDQLGVTAVWLTPVLENDMKDGSYHGYAVTDYYKVDPRFGTNEEYVQLVRDCHKRGLKVVMDMIFNHIGLDHKWMSDLPSKDWVNHPDGDVLTNFRLSTIHDPYASDYDLDHSINGWFVPNKPDLNQRNPHVLRYLEQSSIFWIEEAQIDGIRMDTYPYADGPAMAKWLSDIEVSYPGYNIVGECWYGDAAGTAFWQKDNRLNQKFNPMLKTVMDFPTMIIAHDAFYGETLPWKGGLNEIYGRLSQDYLYADSTKVLVFLENHDSDRFLSEMPTNLDSYKQAVTFLLTTRGIPQMYYGFELLMNGTKDKSDGYVRLDVPGGFTGDKTNNFTAEGRTPLQNEAWDYVSRLAHWRRGNNAISKGSLKHFMPDNEMYVYERKYANHQVIVIMNGNDRDVSIDMQRYAEVMPIGSVYTNVMTGEKVTIEKTMDFSSRATLLLERKQ